MGNATSAISNVPSMITDLWKYVFNAMECRSICCEGAIQCECITHEIQVEIESDDEDVIKAIIQIVQEEK